MLDQKALVRIMTEPKNSIVKLANIAIRLVISESNTQK
jgi:ATP-dependent protease Clp ATPase subunit